MKNDLHSSILATLAYFDIFSLPMRVKEVTQFLYKRSASEKEVFDALEYLRDRGQIERTESFYTLPGRKHLVYENNERKALQKKLWKKVSRARLIIQFIPYLRSVMICNALAMGNVKDTSDIDLFVVIRKDRIWIGRLMITIALTLSGLRRTRTKVIGRMCLSFFVTEDHLDLKKLQRKPYDIYLAYWVRQLKPIMGIEGYRRFQAANSWVDEYLPNFSFYRTSCIFPQSRIARFERRLLEGVLEKLHVGRILNALIRKWLKPRAEKKAANLGPTSSNMVEDRILKFHNNDRRDEFRTSFENRLLDLGFRPA